MEEFFSKYGVKDKSEFDNKVRGDATFAARVAEDYVELVTKAPAESEEIAPASTKEMDEVK